MPQSTAIKPYWYLLHTKPRQEETAFLNLNRQGYSCYLPKFKAQRIRCGKTEWLQEALFPRYLFIHLTHHPDGQTWAPIRSTIGVSQMVCFGGQPARIDDGLIHALQKREQRTEMLFTAGDAVMVTEGPFAGVEAIYSTTNPEQRALVLLKLLNTQVTLPIEVYKLRKVAP